ncbi:tetracenomycin C synthesis protein [Streptomyces lincolnensis]|uniref:class I SAM-dependent methyltransferase n=1 Tax=Streptomyces lincolnensis TaxID=1915 RepID=UPI0008345116|nr:class I SAM-dependent methyltransferase [Streptomyces lincolnensis]AXG52121.1 tetracenomycin C synthesis protein [Streptomyces lincolnensis]QMV05100.1 class I SAM-dependent methyltransferase [Streptomyces lincolnensis]
MPKSKRVPELGEIQETLLIPLYARAVETRKRHGILQDPRAVEMVESIDYDFSRFDGAKSLIGANLRTLQFDSWVRDFLRRHPSGTVVEIGTGLNTRFERLDNGTVHWFDLDLPDVIALRRRFFEDTDRRHTLAASVTDPAWTEAVRASPGPYLLVAEAVLIYLDDRQVRSVVDLVAESLPGAHLALETANDHAIARQDSHDVLGAMAARMKWRCDDPRQLETWRPDLRLTDSRTFADLPAAERRALPLSMRLLLRAMAVLRRRDLESYRLNLFRFGESGTA